jgi:hypothetical protein
VCGGKKRIERGQSNMRLYVAVVMSLLQPAGSTVVQVLTLLARLMFSIPVFQEEERSSV